MIKNSLKEERDINIAKALGCMESPPQEREVGVGCNVIRTLKILPVRPPFLQELKFLLVDTKMTPGLLQIPHVLLVFPSSQGLWTII